MIHGFWAGGPLKQAQIASLRSFIQYGHVYQLWTYDQIKVPFGIILRDANEIVPREVLDRWLAKPCKHLYQSFSNYFRYELIYKEGGYWMDTDIICLRHFDFVEEYVFCGITGVNKRPQLAHLPFNIVNGAFRAPANAPFLASIISKIKVKAMVADYPDFGVWGTVAMTIAAFEYKLDSFKKRENVFVPFGFDMVGRIYNDPTLKIPEWAYAVHLYNYTGPNYNKRVKGTIYSQLMERYG